MLRAPSNHLGFSLSVSYVVKSSSCFKFEAPHGPIYGSRCRIDANSSEAAALQIMADKPVVRKAKSSRQRNLRIIATAESGARDFSGCAAEFGNKSLTSLNEQLLAIVRRIRKSGNPAQWWASQIQRQYCQGSLPRSRAVRPLPFRSQLLGPRFG
jgi:hypothetical protein